jgi:hypothetical protein
MYRAVIARRDRPVTGMYCTASTDAQHLGSGIADLGGEKVDRPYEEGNGP